MSSTTLGKRGRNPSDSSSPNTRSKKRVQFVILDENEKINPFITPRKSGDTYFSDPMDIDSPSFNAASTRKSQRLQATKASTTVTPTRSKIQARAKLPVNTDENKAPQTPTRRDSPLQKPIVTPRNRVLVARKPITPRTPTTPRTPAHPRDFTLTVYNKARQTFAKGAAPTVLSGREKERTELARFFNHRLESSGSGSIYVSGPPGTGKSAFVSEVCKTAGEYNNNVHLSYINCMSLKKADDIHSKLLEDFPVLSLCSLRELFFEAGQSYVVTLDEVDHLADINLDLLYTLYEYSLDPFSNLLLISIANALDFTDRFLPRLRARGLKPQLLPFLPYTAPQIVSIITSKLKSLVPPTTAEPNYVPFINPTAIQFLSKKVAAQSGDLRKTFDICRRAIDLVEAETKEKRMNTQTIPLTAPMGPPQKTPLLSITPASNPPESLCPTTTPLGSPPKQLYSSTTTLESPQKHLQSSTTSLDSPPQHLYPSTTQIRSPPKKPLVENTNLSSPAGSPSKLDKNTFSAPPLAPLTIETAPRATIAHMARITAAVFSNGTSQRLQNLNLQQKAVLCALSASEKKSRRNAVDPFVTPVKRVAAAPTVKTLFLTYSDICKRNNLLHALTNTEFNDIISGLEMLSLVTPVGQKSGSFANPVTPTRKGRGGLGTNFDDLRIASSVGNKELEASLNGVGSGILKEILNSDDF